MIPVCPLDRLLLYSIPIPNQTSCRSPRPELNPRQDSFPSSKPTCYETLVPNFGIGGRFFMLGAPEGIQNHDRGDKLSETGNIVGDTGLRFRSNRTAGLHTARFIW